MDGRFGLAVEAGPLSRILTLCRRAGGTETGGILLGRYSTALDCAIVTSASSAPPDSRSGRTWFQRGVRGLQRLLDRVWREEHRYYLGEWHFHPSALPEPSPVDIAQMLEIAATAEYHCPEPVLLIIGGDPHAEWWAKAVVFIRGGGQIDLLSDASTSAEDEDRYGHS